MRTRKNNKEAVLLRAMALGRKAKWAKEFRKLELERLLYEFVLENFRWPGATELAESLNVSPRTVRNYLKERRIRLNGPDKIWVHWYADGKSVGPPELLTIEEYARRTGRSLREMRRQIWEERKDRIAAIRELYAKDRSVEKDSTPNAENSQ